MDRLIQHRLFLKILYFVGWRFVGSIVELAHSLWGKLTLSSATKRPFTPSTGWARPGWICSQGQRTGSSSGGTSGTSVNLWGNKLGPFQTELKNCNYGYKTTYIQGVPSGHRGGWDKPGHVGGRHLPRVRGHYAIQVHGGHAAGKGGQLQDGAQAGELQHDPRGVWWHEEEQDHECWQEPLLPQKLSCYQVSTVVVFISLFIIVNSSRGPTAKIWCEDIKSSAIMWTKPSSARLNGGCWSPVRMSVFFTVREDGVLDCWDILYNHNRPVLQVKIADHPLYAIKVLLNVAWISSGNSPTIIECNEWMNFAQLFPKHNNVQCAWYAN